MLFSGEREAVKRAVSSGAAFGYGNIIDRLKIAWVLQLKKREGITWKSACLGALLDEERTNEIVKSAKKDEEALIAWMKSYTCQEDN